MGSHTRTEGGGYLEQAVPGEHGPLHRLHDNGILARRQTHRLRYRAQITPLGDKRIADLHQHYAIEAPQRAKLPRP